MRSNPFLAVPALILACGAAHAQLTPVEQLGRSLFFDTRLSTPPGQACATCHTPAAGYTSPDSDINAHGAVYHGVIEQRFGPRKPPSAAYGGDAPILHFDEVIGAWVGGTFWDGRATGWTLGDPLAEQAMGPFLNNLEQNMPHMRQVVRRVQLSEYAPLFRTVWGANSLDPVKDVAASYERIARSIAAYERSIEVNPFSSKYDFYLRGEATLSPVELRGLEVFEGIGRCAECHISRPDASGRPPLFTDFTYDNLGVPRNPENPFYSAPHATNPAGEMWVDMGLGGFLASAGYDPEVFLSELGKHKVPSLRNVDLRPEPGFVKAYMHNGVFKSLEDVVHFYNTRDLGGWDEPEVAVNVNTDELGDLGLSADDEAAVVAFLKTLNDGFTP